MMPVEFKPPERPKWERADEADASMGELPDEGEAERPWLLAAGCDEKPRGM